MNFWCYICGGGISEAVIEKQIHKYTQIIGALGIEEMKELVGQKNNKKI